jgi:hypothetical protein
MVFIADTPPRIMGETTGRKRKGRSTSPYFDVVVRNENSVPTTEKPIVPRTRDGSKDGSIKMEAAGWLFRNQRV